MNSEARVAIILAGNEQSRLRLGASDVGVKTNVPDQFRRSFGGPKVFEQTRRRTALAFSPEKIMYVFTRAQRSLYRELLSDVPSSRMVVQPRNRGTAASMLYALLRSESLFPSPAVAVFPSHHHVGDDAAFMRHVDLAFEGVKARSDLSILLGASADTPGGDYCWIEMGQRVNGYLQLFQIRNFWENPSRALAIRLWQAGCLWNSSIVVARLPVLLALIRHALPQLAASFEELRPAIGTEGESGAVDAVYDAIADSDFAHAVSAKHPENLAVLPLSGIEWSDLERSRRAISGSLHSGSAKGRERASPRRRRN